MSLSHSQHLGLSGKPQEFGGSFNGTVSALVGRAAIRTTALISFGATFLQRHTPTPETPGGGIFYAAAAIFCSSHAMSSERRHTTRFRPIRTCFRNSPPFSPPQIVACARVVIPTTPPISRRSAPHPSELQYLL